MRVLQYTLCHTHQFVIFPLFTLSYLNSNVRGPDTMCEAPTFVGNALARMLSICSSDIDIRG